MKNLLLNLLLLVACISCSSPRLEHEQKSGNSNVVKTGKAFHVNLPEDHTTPYLWSLSNNYNSTLVNYMGSLFHSNEKGVDFNFEALKPGKTDLTFYLRSYNDTSDIKTFTVEIK
ncbi:MAG: protease inhibitor I42 family protein [Bacteroidia bacterium]